ncbi:ribose-5-phosphate isomerase [Brachybacterium sp. AOP43-C2-M15]|uniref:ribose-5-phosphate isomerase n=1 Tax=Brachybacterium sp. AOP43-C2-M15 TaxID=3457661 RepID=UPI004033BF08
MGWKIVTGSDNAGYGHKSALKELLESDPRVDAVLDVGVTGREDGTYYPNVAVEAAERIAAGEADRALLICGTGLGVAIAANKVPGVRAVTAHDLYSVQRSVLSNNAQVLCMGERVVGLELAQELVKVWLDLEFDPASSSAAKVDAICAYDGSLEQA